MLLLGIDAGTSFIKVSVVESDTQKCIATAQYPDNERTILSTRSGFAEQSPQQWWEDVKMAIQQLNATRLFEPKNIAAIGISYQMHGLVCIDKNQQVLRNSIIWCDSRAVEIGYQAFIKIGEEKCLSHLLNSPGNFTASKLKWVKENEPELFDQIDKIMLPGDYIAMQLTGEISTSIAALSEGIFWDFKNNCLSEDVLNTYGFSKSLIPAIKNVFAEHGKLSSAVANELSLTPKIPVTYKAGDQPNNALSLNVMKPGEVAATAGTSGVIYSVTNQLSYDSQSRVNSFAHVNHSQETNNLGILLCINGTGIMNRWIKNIAGNQLDYEQINTAAAKIPAGSDGLHIFPFGNGSERMLNNRTINASMQHIDLNIHTQSHIFRSVQEGIAFAFRYGFDILKENGIEPAVIRAGKANMFLSPVFRETFVQTIKVPVELFHNDGSTGAALGAGIGAGIFTNTDEAFRNMKSLLTIEPTETGQYEAIYQQWKNQLIKQIE